MPPQNPIVRAAVTVDRSRDDLDGSPFLDPLRRLGDDVEVTLVDGPGGWGTEVHARWRTADRRRAPGRLERALREVRQLAETGEVLRNEPRPAGRRRRTPGGAVVDWAERRSDGFVNLRRLWASRP